MGFAPAQIDDMSLWQFSMCVEGWNKHHSPDEDKGVPLSDEEAADLGRWLDQR